MTSIDSDFGLRKNPFSTQGSDTSKTDFVPTKAFKELTDKIDQVRHQKNSRAIIRCNEIAKSVDLSRNTCSF